MKRSHPDAHSPRFCRVKLGVSKDLLDHFPSWIVGLAFLSAVSAAGEVITPQSCGKAPVSIASSLWTSPTSANLPFHVSNLWLSCLRKRNWFYYKALASPVTPNWYHTCDVIPSDCFYPTPSTRTTYVLSPARTVPGHFRLCGLVFCDKHRILFFFASLFSFRWALDSE